MHNEKMCVTDKESGEMRSVKGTRVLSALFLILRVIEEVKKTYHKNIMHTFWQCELNYIKSNHGMKFEMSFNYRIRKNIEMGD